jgi:hypothetical protein
MADDLQRIAHHLDLMDAKLAAAQQIALAFTVLSFVAAAGLIAVCLGHALRRWP